MKKNIKKHLIKVILLIGFIFYVKNYFSQINLIPNGDFENSKQPVNCTSSAGCSITQNDFNSQIYNWEAAIHNNDASNKNDIGNIYYIDISNSTCQGVVLSNSSYCTSLIPSHLSFTKGTKFVRIRADLDKCKRFIEGTKYKHGAIGVALEGGKKFKKDQNYIIRYKIVPLRSRNCDGKKNHDQDICTGTQYISHIRFFLSELGPQHWDKSSSDKQELINVNYVKDVSSIITTCSDPLTGNSYRCHPCVFMQQVRKFKPNQNNYTTLVIYAESGGAFIDDVEVFEECLSPYLIQNKSYAYPMYTPNSVNNTHMSEQSGGTLKAGKNVDNSKQQGDVEIFPNTKVIYTASDEIALLDGFGVYLGAEFSAVIQPCPNTYNVRMTNKDSIDHTKNFDINIVPNSEDVVLIPNPASTHFHISMAEEDFNDLKKIEIVDVLGRVRELPISEMQDISEFSEGVYMVKFYFSKGMLVVKSLVIKR